MPVLLLSELPVRAKVRHHWVTMVLHPRPHPVLLVALLIMLLAAIGKPNPMAWLLGGVVLAAAILRWRSWSAEWVLLTGKRIIRVQDAPEVTATEASLRVDRITGLVLVKTIPAKILGYSTIELEAPGHHPDLRRLKLLRDPDDLFYRELRRMVFAGQQVHLDPWDDPPPPGGGDQPGYATEPLPPYPPGGGFFGRNNR